jgi:hypothetical protein
MQDEEIIQDIPNFVSSNTTIIVQPGDTVELVCQVNKMNPLVPILWEFESNSNWKILAIDQSKVYSSRNFTIERLQGNLEGLKLILPNIQSKTDGGIYQCVLASNVQGDDAVFYKLIIQEDTNNGLSTGHHISSVFIAFIPIYLLISYN